MPMPFCNPCSCESPTNCCNNCLSDCAEMLIALSNLFAIGTDPGVTDCTGGTYLPINGTLADIVNNLQNSSYAANLCCPDGGQCSWGYFVSNAIPNQTATGCGISLFTFCTYNDCFFLLAVNIFPAGTVVNKDACGSPPPTFTVPPGKWSVVVYLLTSWCDYCNCITYRLDLDAEPNCSTLYGVEIPFYYQAAYDNTHTALGAVIIDGSQTSVTLTCNGATVPVCNEIDNLHDNVNPFVNTTTPNDGINHDWYADATIAVTAATNMTTIQVIVQYTDAGGTPQTVNLKQTGTGLTFVTTAGGAQTINWDPITFVAKANTAIQIGTVCGTITGLTYNASGCIERLN